MVDNDVRGAGGTLEEKHLRFRPYCNVIARTDYARRPLDTIAT